MTMGKIFIGCAATLIAAAAFAQTAGSNSGTSSTGAMQPADSMSTSNPGGDNMSSGMTSEQMMQRDGVTMKNGKMMKNGKAMTTSETAAYKSKMKDPNYSKPM